jgi:hypothetical protein
VKPFAAVLVEERVGLVDEGGWGGERFRGVVRYGCELIGEGGRGAIVTLPRRRNPHHL